MTAALRVVFERRAAGEVEEIDARRRLGVGVRHPITDHGGEQVEAHDVLGMVLQLHAELVEPGKHDLMIAQLLDRGIVAHIVDHPDGPTTSGTIAGAASGQRKEYQDEPTASSQVRTCS